MMKKIFIKFLKYYLKNYNFIILKKLINYIMQIINFNQYKLKRKIKEEKNYLNIQFKNKFIIYIVNK